MINEFGHLLLIQRDDSRTWAPPGGGLDAGELPTDGVVREVEEETGVKTVAVRPVALYFRAERKGDLLIIVFRNLKRGGEPRPSDESLQVGYVPVDELPNRMLGIHREIIQDGYAHRGGPPLLKIRPLPWGVRFWRNVLYSWRDYRRRWQGEPPYQADFDWQAGAFVILRDEAGHVLWAQRRDDGRWNLPGGRVEPGEAPWQAAIREALEETGLQIAIERVTGIYTKADIGEIVFNFAGRIVGGDLSETAESQAYQWLPAASPPADALVNHLARLQDAEEFPDMTVIKAQQSQRPLA